MIRLHSQSISSAFARYRSNYVASAFPLSFCVLQADVLHICRSSSAAGAFLQLAHSSVRVRSLVIKPPVQSLAVLFHGTSPQIQSLFCAVRIPLTSIPIFAWTVCRP